MINKRTALIVGIIAGSILLIGPLGLSPVFLIMGLVLSVIVAKKGDRVAVELIQRGQVTVTEIREKRKKPEPTHPNAPTVPLKPKEEPITGHFVLQPDPSPPPPPDPEPDNQEPAFMIGTTEDGRTITLDEISSLGVGGVPGSGKTVAMVGLCTQAVVKYRGNIRFLVVDPHMRSGSKETLSARMAPLAPFYLNVENLPNPVYGGGDLLKWIKWLDKQAKDRIGGNVPWNQQTRLVLVADEFTALLDSDDICDPLTNLLLLINEQARKVGLFALVASPQWKSSRVQGTEVRNTIASFLVHNMTPNIARQLLPYEEAEKANRLQKGQAIFSSFGQVEVVRVPFMSTSDIERCVQPYLPVVGERPIPVFGELVIDDKPAVDDQTPEPGIAEVKRVWQTYNMLNRDLEYDEENVILALAIHCYPGDPRGQEKVRRALKLGEEHL